MVEMGGVMVVMSGMVGSVVIDRVKLVAGVTKAERTSLK